jgi:DNA end-binding protein Ku
VPKVEISANELDMAISLIKVMTGNFQPGDYKDEYQTALREMVNAKIKGEKIAVSAGPKIEIGDLMASLRASIEAAKKEPAVSRS